MHTFELGKSLDRIVYWCNVYNIIKKSCKYIQIECNWKKVVNITINYRSYWYQYV